MKKLLLLIYFLSFSLPAHAQTYTIERVIDSNTIVVTTPEGKSEVVVLIGIKAPKNRQDYDVKRPNIHNQDLEMITKLGQEAKEFVENLTKDIFIGEDGISGGGLEGKKVRLEFDAQQRDKYGRLLAYVYDIETYHGMADVLSPLGYEITFGENGGEIFINATIIKSGYASLLTIPPNVKYAELFEELYQQAREKKKGLWMPKEGMACNDNSDCQNFKCGGGTTIVGCSNAGRCECFYMEYW